MKKGYSKVFMWLFIGLLITFFIGYTLSLYPITMSKIFTGYNYVILIILELGIAIFFSARLNKMSKKTAIICYILYSFLTGLTFGTIFYVYELMSILSVFLATSLMFLVFAVIGYKTNKNLSKLSTWLFMSLIAVLIASVINIFIQSSAFELIITILFILIFLGYIVFDMKNVEALMDNVGEEKGAIFGAFQLYLDFINLFIRLLEILGKFKDN